MVEPVRLVIWDLDEAFWNGTLTEGGISFVGQHLEIVKELARRGIISSICSKNDFATVEKILREHDAWDWFVFPSISWEPKGPRIAALIEAIQLRPPTCLFIDDNPLNLNEARHFVPDLQIQDHTSIASLLEDPRFKGKNDQALSRLAQYKTLERRKADEVAASSDPIGFLRESDIRVYLEFDVEKHIDRAVELVNRTNQLNFTKKRLPENTDLAKKELKDLLGRFSYQAALVRVIDRYGDHGYCGFYLFDSENRHLVHFCFSCRILGMGVEQYLFNKMKRPGIHVQGEVLTDLFDQSREIDWIRQITSMEAAAGAGSPSRRFPFDRITARGSCDIGAIQHYITSTVPDAVGEYNVHRAGSTFRVEHSVFLRQAAQGGLTPAALSAAKKLGYLEADFATRVFDVCDGGQLVILAFSSDVIYPLYRHRQTGLTVPFVVVNRPVNEDARQLDESDLPNNSHAAWMKQALTVLKDEFEFIGRIDGDNFKAGLRQVLSRIPNDSKVVVLETNDQVVDWSTGAATPVPVLANLNEWTREVCRSFTNVVLLKTSESIQAQSDLQPVLRFDHMPDVIHFNRKVYFRMFERIVSLFQRENAEPLGPEHSLAVA
jgi:FkbH-like protein